MNPNQHNLTKNNFNYIVRLNMKEIKIITCITSDD